MNTYYRLWNGEDILESDDTSKTRKISLDKIVANFFYNTKIGTKTVSQIANSTRLLDCTYDGNHYNLLVLELKNSGLTSEQYRKRMQISKNIDFCNDSPIYALGYYNAGDKIIYVSTEITQFVYDAQKGKTYSSYWVDYAQLKKTYEQDYAFWLDRRGRYVSAMTNEKKISLSSEELAQQIFCQNNEFTVKHPSVFDNDEPPIEFDEKLYIQNGRKLPRNRSYVEKALERANYKCELCGCDITFDTPEDKQYFEGHHLIMYNYEVQKRYKYSLDNINNIVCLCPNCHKKIHYAKDETKEECVLTLLQSNLHRDLFDIYKINTSDDIQLILNDYFMGVSDDN